MRQQIIDSVTGRSYWYCPEMKFGKVPDSEAEVIRKTNMTPSDFKDCFDWTKWWCACSEKDKPAQSWIVDKSSIFPFCFNDGGISKLIVFDMAVLDGKQAQVIRTLQFVEKYKEGKVIHYYARECSRILINSGNIKFIEFPTGEGNRPEVYVPFFGIQETRNLYYSIGGFHGLGPSIEMPQESYYYFRSIAPGIKPAEVIKKLLGHIVGLMESVRKEMWRGIWDRVTFNRDLMLDLFIQGGLAEDLIKNEDLLINMFSPYFHPGKDIEELLCYKKSVRVGLRHGAMKWLSTPHGRGMYLDVLRMLESLGKDMLSPKYVAPESLADLHDQLISEERKKREKKQIEQAKETIKQYNPIYKQKKGDILEKAWESNSIIITPLQNIEEFMQVGDQLHICVFTAGYYKRDSLICKAVSKENNILLACLEFNQDSMELIQCRGLCNGKPDKEEDILKLVKKISA